MLNEIIAMALIIVCIGVFCFLAYRLGHADGYLQALEEIDADLASVRREIKELLDE